MRKRKVVVAIATMLATMSMIGGVVWADSLDEQSFNIENLVIEEAKEDSNLDLEIFSETTTIVRVPQEDKVRLTENGVEVTLSLFVSGAKDKEHIRGAIFLDDTKQNIPINITDSKNNAKSAKKIVIFTLPPNTTGAQQVYTVKFSSDLSNDIFTDEFDYSITLSPSARVEPVITSSKVSKVELPKEGGKIGVTVRGTDLDKGYLNIKVYKIDKGKEIEQADLVQNVSFEGTDKIRTAYIDLPSSTSMDEYVFKFGYDDNLDQIKTVKVGDKNSNKLTVISPAEVFIDSKNKFLTLKFDEEIFVNGDLEKLKKAISIVTDNKEQKLTDDDKLELEGSKILITFKEELQLKSLSKVKLEERAIRDSKNMDNKEFAFIIHKNKAIIDKVEILEGEKLDSKGGLVRIKISGHDLGDTKAKVARNTRIGVYDENIEVKVEKVESRADKEQIISFTLPKNETSRLKTYSTLVSLDGRTYSSAIGANIYDRTKRIVLAVFPEGADMEKPTLSFISIQSYGTSGGGAEVPDITHTDTPIGQESKKTLAYVYGANLSNTLTKVKIVDANGIEWTPLNDAGTDSMDQFIMIGFDHTGIAGNGNNQLLEIICPRNIAGDNKYKYLVAVDGEHFDEEVYVTATVVDDKSGPKQALTSENIKEVKLNFVDEDGKEIAQSSIAKGYIWARLVAFNAVAKQIDGYELVSYKLGNKSIDSIIWGEPIVYERYDGVNVGAADEVTFIYKKVGAKKEVESDKKSELEEKNEEKPEVKVNHSNIYGSFGGGSSYSGKIRQVRKIEKGSWKKDEKGWWYKNADGSFVSNAWKEIEYKGKKTWFYFGNDGYMYTGWKNYNNKWYYMADDGAMLTSTTTPDGYKVNELGEWVNQ